MNLRDRIEQARDFISNGGRPRSVLATNGKTEYSCFDNFPQLTCFGMCPVRRKCYDVRTLNQYPNAEKARLERHFFLFSRPVEYVNQLVAEVNKKRNKPSRLRIYAGGDFTPFQTPALLRALDLLPDVQFYMISKTIRQFNMHAIQLLQKPNFFLVLSEMNDYRFDSVFWGKLWRGHPRVNKAYTLMADEIDFERARQADIIFNVSKTKKSIAKYKAAELPLCPCDAKDIPSKGACAACNLCTTKGGVRVALTMEKEMV